MSRGVALFLSLVALVSLLAAFRSPVPSADFWWIDLRPFAPDPARGLLAASAVLMALFAIIRPLPAPLRYGGISAVLLLAAAVLWHVVTHGMPERNGAPTWIAYEVYIGGLLAVVLAGMLREPLPATHRSRSFALGLLAFWLCALGLPLAQMYCGRPPEIDKTPAEAIVIVGCRLDAEGRPSRALERRVEQGAQLFRENGAKALVLSVEPTGEDPSPIVKLAVAAGVPETSVIVDPRADSTRTAIAHAVESLNDVQLTRAIVTSRHFHLPRIRLGFLQRGWNVRTLPLIEPDPVTLDWPAIGGEIAAQWADFLRPLVDVAQQRLPGGNDANPRPSGEEQPRAESVERLFPADP